MTTCPERNLTASLPEPRPARWPVTWGRFRIAATTLGFAAKTAAGTANQALMRMLIQTRSRPGTALISSPVTALDMMHEQDRHPPGRNPSAGSASSGRNDRDRRFGSHSRTLAARVSYTAQEHQLGDRVHEAFRGKMVAITILLSYVRIDGTGAQ